MKKQRILLIYLFFTAVVTAQNFSKDTLKLEEIIITATKTKRQLSSITVPVTLIKQKDIQVGSSLKLQNVLGEITGLNLTSSALGVGIQLQGLDPSYTLIMIDGQPLAGRLNGTLDLSRLTIDNIDQIEIVNGPSSVLYGSEALAGVVNIITKKAKKGSVSIDTKISSFDTYNFSAQGTLVKNKLKASIFANYYTTQGYSIASNYQGYNLGSQYYGKTVSPHQNYTLTSNVNYQLTKEIDFDINTRYFIENQDYKFIESNLNLVSGNGTIKDLNIAPSINMKLNDKIKIALKTYLTNYDTNTEEINENNTLYGHTFFNEKHLNVELQTDYKITKKHTATLGFGYANELVATSKLFDEKSHKANNKYVFAQYLFDYNKKLNLVVGTRFDKHDAYTNQFNPKISLSYRVFSTLSIKASIGRGFKRPTFKQLYFNYTNNAIGYTILGTTYVAQGIENLLAANQIAVDPNTNAPILYNLYYDIINSGGIIEPESSIGKNIGFKISKIPNTIIDINFFRNDLENLIDTTPIALKTNGWQAYSYQNLSRVFSQGFTINIKNQLTNKIKITAGYQYLEVKDKDVLDQIDGIGVFAQDPITLSSYRVSKKDYGGLLNRSKHTANIKFFTEDIYKGINANFRVLFKGKYGFADLNNNQILDADNEYTDAYFLANTSISKSFFKNKLRLQAGIDNLFDFTYATPEYTMSSLPGRVFFTNINYKF